jgi:diadenosine tetraphosphatase ApaH/serine/threonine PP2A family protein phosphatase
VRYGVFGDVHSSRDALAAVLGLLESQKVDGYLCVGDIVGYGADAAECVERVRDLDPWIVAGNHDWAVPGKLGLEYFNAQAQAAILFTRKVLGPRDVEWLAALPLTLEVDGLTLAHGTVHDPQHFDYLQTAYDAYLSFAAMRNDTAFVGHSHVPVTFFEGNPVTYSCSERIEFGQRRAICNPGSVGQPRDEDPRASCAVYDAGQRVLEVHRVAYDIPATIGRVLRAGLPPLLGERLRVGR